MPTLWRQCSSASTLGQLLEAGGTNDATLAHGDLVINGVAVGASLSEYDSLFCCKTASAIAKAEAINQVSDQTGVLRLSERPCRRQL